MFYRFSLIVLGYALFATSLFAGDLSPELQKNADYTLQGFDDTIMRINSGICRINGQSKVGSKTSDDEFEIAFDFANNYYRFDRKGQCHSLRTPEYYYEFWHPDGKGKIIERQLSSVRYQSHMAKPFDIRALGFSLLLDFTGTMNTNVIFVPNCLVIDLLRTSGYLMVLFWSPQNEPPKQRTFRQ